MMKDGTSDSFKFYSTNPKTTGVPPELHDELSAPISRYIEKHQTKFNSLPKHNRHFLGYFEQTSNEELKDEQKQEIFNQYFSQYLEVIKNIAYSCKKETTSKYQTISDGEPITPDGLMGIISSMLPDHKDAQEWVSGITSFKEQIFESSIIGILAATAYDHKKIDSEKWQKLCNSPEMSSIRYLFSPIIRDAFNKKKGKDGSELPYDSPYSPDECELMRECFLYLANMEKAEIPERVQGALRACKETGANAMIYRTPPVTTCEANKQFSYAVKAEKNIPEETKTLAYIAHKGRNGVPIGIFVHTTEDRTISQSSIRTILRSCGYEGKHELDENHDIFSSTGFAKGRFSPAALVGAAEDLQKAGLTNAIHIYDPYLLRQPSVTDGFGQGSYGIYVENAPEYFDTLMRQSALTYNRIYGNFPHVITGEEGKTGFYDIAQKETQPSWATQVTESQSPKSPATPAL